jgi:ABC-type Zn uptake system ZnuABC Zn-binding protein ZnuA
LTQENEIFEERDGSSKIKCYVNWKTDIVSMQEMSWSKRDDHIIMSRDMARKLVKFLEKELEELDNILEEELKAIAKDVNPKLKIIGKDLLPKSGD